MYSNDDNNEWNANHLGKRVPINDTGIDGAPFTIAGSKDWLEGSVNNAVYSTHLLKDTPPVYPDEDQATLGVLGIKPLLKYTNKEMLYGYSADARNKIPGDAMSFRGYPTPIITLNTLALISNPSNLAWDYIGNTYGSAGQFVVMSYTPTIKFKVPYNIQYTVELTNGLTSYLIVEVQIASGSLTVTHYRLVGEETWIALPDNKIYFSVDSSGLAGSQTFTATITDFIQSPYYGDLSPVDLIVSISGSPPVASTLGPAYYGDGLSEFIEYSERCREYSGHDLFPKMGAPTLYLRNIDILKVGTTLYLDETALTPASNGQFMYVVPAYHDSESGENIYAVIIYLILNSSGIITNIINPVPEGYLGVGCRLII